MRLTAEKIEQAAADGLTMNEAAQRLRVQPSSIGKWKRRLGIEFRPANNRPAQEEQTHGHP